MSLSGVRISPLTPSRTLTLSGKAAMSEKWHPSRRASGLHSLPAPLRCKVPQPLRHLQEQTRLGVCLALLQPEEKPLKAEEEKLPLPHKSVTAGAAGKGRKIMVPSSCRGPALANFLLAVSYRGRETPPEMVLSTWQKGYCSHLKESSPRVHYTAPARLNQCNMDHPNSSVAGTGR